MNERTMVLGTSRSLVGVATLPPGDAVDPDRPALIVLNAGHVHRVGPHRLHVRLNRRIAQRGFMAMRFDFSGIGDSPPRPDSLPFEQSAPLEVREVMDDLERATGVRRFCIAGLSSGALLSLASAVADRRVVGACMMNPHGFAQDAQWTEHVERLSESRIYARNVFQLDSWRKLLTGKTNYRRLARALWYKAGEGRHRAKVAGVVEQARPVLADLLKLEANVLVLFSEKDRSLENFDEILGPGWRERVGANVEVAILRGANHTFARPMDLEAAVDAVEGWMLRCWPAGGRA
ncbi:MAG: alpha/beta fold hydrolase [Betaproteobacteria bacterium]